MQQIKFSEIAVKKIKNRELEKIIPELYELEKVFENNRSHNNDSVFSHTISVLIELEKLFDRVNKGIKDYLEQKVDFHSRKELLFFAAVFHDIGKKETLEREKDITKCPGHEKISSKKLQDIIPRFLLSDKERGMIIQIISNHGFLHNLLDNPGDNLNKKAKEFQEKCHNIFLEFVLLTIADVLGGQLKENNPKEFDFRIDFLEKILNSY